MSTPKPWQWNEHTINARKHKHIYVSYAQRTSNVDSAKMPLLLFSILK